MANTAAVLQCVKKNPKQVDEDLFDIHPEMMQIILSRHRLYDRDDF